MVFHHGNQTSCAIEITSHEEGAKRLSYFTPHGEEMIGLDYFDIYSNCGDGCGKTSRSPTTSLSCAVVSWTVCVYLDLEKHRPRFKRFVRTRERAFDMENVVNRSLFYSPLVGGMSSL